ncbi:MAG: STAS domain-containing protein [Thermodesulfobacteriota bacterium]
MDVKVLTSDRLHTRVALAGRIDPDGVHDQGYQFHKLAAFPHKNLVVDMTEVTFIASLGIGMLLTAAKELAATGNKMVLLAPRKLVEGTLRTAGLTGVIHISRTLDEALRYLDAR